MIVTLQTFRTLFCLYKWECVGDGVCWVGLGCYGCVCMVVVAWHPWWCFRSNHSRDDDHIHTSITSQSYSTHTITHTLSFIHTKQCAKLLQSDNHRTFWECCENNRDSFQIRSVPHLPPHPAHIDMLHIPATVFLVMGFNRCMLNSNSFLYLEELYFKSIE